MAISTAFSKKKLLGVLLIIGFLAIALPGLLQPGHSNVDFNTQVKPILNKHCIHCHGGVRQNGGLSMMTREDLLKEGESGNPAVVPGHPGQSELIRRIITDDPQERMPLEAPGLTKDEIEVLHNWIAEGAEWGLHWAYRPVESVKVPSVRNFTLASSAGKGAEEEWTQNDIDRFILKRLVDEDLSPSPRADKRTLLRRASLDLIGMPAPQELAQSYLQDDSEGAYEQLIDRLLNEPAYGERWAAVWMDLARYADTKGFERDARRAIWPYRDWLIRAFNQDKPYDEFLTEQLAGDLLPDPTITQYIATGFHRNTKTNDEGGTDNEEFRVAAVIDRVNTTWEVLMGTTFACTQCHGHPYDPFEHADYYKFMAFFNNSRDEDTAEDYPLLRLFSSTDSLELEELTKWVQGVESEKRAKEMKTFLRTWQPVYYSIATDSFVNAALYDTKHLTFRNYASARLSGVELTGVDRLIYRFKVHRGGGQWKIRLDRPDGPVIGTHEPPKKPGWSFAEIPLRAVPGRHDLYFTYSNPKLTDPGAAGLAFDWFYFTKSFPGEGRAGYTEQKNRFWKLMDSRPKTTLIMMDNPLNRQRVTKVFDRGNWQVHKETVEPGVPAVFPPLPADAPSNRLGLAQWLTDSRHPLTSRTLVNRIWEQLFGRGLAETLEDLGTQGIPPSHPELLDHLSYQLMHQYDWSIKQLLKQIVLSATYQQQSIVQDEHQTKDPLNLWYARMPRVRLSAEQIRDQTLVVSGLLHPEMYGPSVMPYQPDGVWSTAYNNSTWNMSPGKDKYRRALYTFWKRSAPYPAMTTFDATAREVCTSRRIRTNTPLQALVTLNDESFMEAAQHFGLFMLSGSEGIEEGIARGYERAIGHPISKEKLQVLLELFRKAKRMYETEEEELARAVEGLETEEDKLSVAAITMVANAIFNLDEFVSKS